MLVGAVGSGDLRRKSISAIASAAAAIASTGSLSQSCGDKTRDEVGDIDVFHHDFQQYGEADSWHDAACHAEAVNQTRRQNIYRGFGMFRAKVNWQERA